MIRHLRSAGSTGAGNAGRARDIFVNRCLGREVGARGEGKRRGVGEQRDHVGTFSEMGGFLFFFSSSPLLLLMRRYE